MADGRRVQVLVDVVQGTTTGKKIVTDLEKEVIASAKRVEANRKATDRAILASQTATNNEAKRNAKQTADAFIQELKRTEREAKTSTTSIRSYLQGAFGGGLVGGFAGGLFGSLTAQMAQLPAFFKTQLDEMVRIAAERQNAFRGLASVAGAKGILGIDAEDAVRDLRLVRAGVVDIASAATALKNLLATGFSLPQAIKLMEAFSDAAAFGKQSALSYGDAIRGATEGIKNQNSILVDNAGITKNLSVILEEAGFSAKDLGKVTTDVNVRMALYNGLIKEAQINTGDADKLTQGWTGSTAALTTAQDNLYAAIGDIIIRNPELIATVKTLTGELNLLTKEFKDTESAGTSLVSRLSTLFAQFTIDLSADIRKEVADLKELGNIMEFVGSSLEAFYYRSLLFGAGSIIYQDKIEQLRKQGMEAYGRIGSYYKEGQIANERMRREYEQNLQQSRPPSTFGRPGGLPASPFGLPNNVAFPGMLGTTTTAPGGTTGGGGGGRVRAPRNTDDRDLRAIRELAAEYGFTITSGVRTRGTTGIHATGRAADISVKGKSDEEIGQLIAAALEKGIRIVDERRKIPGSPFWTGPHLHAEINNRRESILAGGGYGSIPAGFLRSLDAKRFAKTNVTADEIAEWNEKFGTKITTTGDVFEGTIEYRKREREELKQLGDVYEDLIRKTFDLQEHTEKENFLLDVKLGRYPELNAATVEEIANQYALIDARKKKLEEDKRAAEEQAEWDRKVTQEIEALKREEYDKTRNLIEESLDYLTRGDLKGLGRSMMERSRRAVVERTTDWIMEKLGFENPNDTPELREAKRQTQLLRRIVINTSGGAGNGLISDVLRTGGIGLGSGMDWPGLPSAGLGINPTTGTITTSGSVRDINGRIVGTQTVGGRGGFLGGLFGARRNLLKKPGMPGSMSSLAGKLGGIGDIASMAGGMIGGKWGNLMSMTGMGLSIGANFGPWGAAIGAGIGAAAGFISMLFGGDNAIKKIKEAALSTYGLTVKDKSTLNAIKAIGETYFGKGKVGKNAMQLMQVDEVKNILRNYAEATGQNSEKIDMLSHGDENWSGNNFRSSFGGKGRIGFGGMRMAGGIVSRGSSYLVGERGPEKFTPSVSGTITAGTSDVQMKVIMGRVEEVLTLFAERLTTVSPGHVLTLGAAENPQAITDAHNRQLENDPRTMTEIRRREGTYI